MLPSRILKSPIRPTSIRTLCGAIAPVPVGCPRLETGAAVSDANSMSLFPASSFLARVAVTRLGDLDLHLSQATAFFGSCRDF